MHRRSPLHRLAIGSLTAAGALIALAAAPVANPASAGPDGTGPSDDTDAPVVVRRTTGTATGSNSDSDSDAPPGTAPDRAVFERQIDMMLGLVPQDEVEEYYNQQNVEYERRIADCMIEAGFEYSPQSSGGVVMASGGLEWAQQWGFGMYTTMDPENNPWMTETEWHDPNGEYLESLSESEQTAFWAQQNRCYESVSWNDDSSAMWSNSDFQRVMEDFWTDLQNDPKLVAATRAWAGCMEEAGHPYSTEDEIYEEWFSENQWEKQMRFYESEAWLSTSPDHDEWQRLVEEEISLAVAQIECNEPINEAREEVMHSKRSELLELYQTIDWSAPPVTYPDYVDEWNFDGTIVVAGADTPETTDAGTDDGEPRPSTTRRDNSGGSDTSTTTTRPRIDLSGVNNDG